MAIALQPKFPIPDRTSQPVRSMKDEDGVIDIGWCEGILSDDNCSTGRDELDQASALAVDPARRNRKSTGSITEATFSQGQISNL